MKPGEGVIGAISKKATGTGGHFWVATEYLSTSGEEKNAVMHLTAAGGLGDSQSGGSGESSGSRGVGDSTGSHLDSRKAVGSVQSAVVSNEEDSGFMSYSGSTNSNVGSAEPATFKGSVTINIDESASNDYLGNLAKKSIRTWDITEAKGEKALAKAQKMDALSKKGKYIYTLTGRTISFTKTGMNCARFAENVLNAAGIKANAGWIIKTPSELSTGKKAGFR